MASALKLHTARTFLIYCMKVINMCMLIKKIKWSFIKQDDLQQKCPQKNSQDPHWNHPNCDLKVLKIQSYFQSSLSNDTAQNTKHTFANSSMTSCTCCANMWHICCFLISSTGKSLLKNAISMFHLAKNANSVFLVSFINSKNSRSVLSHIHFRDLSTLIEIKPEMADGET